MMNTIYFLFVIYNQHRIYINHHQMADSSPSVTEPLLLSWPMNLSDSFSQSVTQVSVSEWGGCAETDIRKTYAGKPPSFKVKRTTKVTLHLGKDQLLNVNFPLQQFSLEQFVFAFFSLGMISVVILDQTLVFTGVVPTLIFSLMPQMNVLFNTHFTFTKYQNMITHFQCYILLLH